jgi:hypothetical protein
MDPVKIDILKEHLPYELDMLDQATAYLPDSPGAC